MLTDHRRGRNLQVENKGGYLGVYKTISSKEKAVY